MIRIACTGFSFLVMALAARAGDVVEIDGLKSKTPDAWKKGTPGPLQFATFSLPKAEGDPEDAAVVIYFFGKGGGGPVNDNLARWKNMFKAPAGEKARVDKMKVGDVEVTTIELAGTYLFKARPMDATA